ncbi:MAG: His/Gly/Thr/Pro-type tRNA ligase C-terminal domain-containing protein, partial [Thermoprotei archaeon]
KKKVGEVLSDIVERGYDYAIFLGEKEIKERTLTIKNLKEKTQKTIRIDELEEAVYELLRENK